MAAWAGMHMARTPDKTRPLSPPMRGRPVRRVRPLVAHRDADPFLAAGVGVRLTRLGPGALARRLVRSLTVAALIKAGATRFFLHATAGVEVRPPCLGPGSFARRLVRSLTVAALIKAGRLVRSLTVAALIKAGVRAISFLHLRAGLGARQACAEPGPGGGGTWRRRKDEG